MTIIGSGFVSPLQVFFGVVEAKVVTVSFNQIVVLSPPASGAGLPNLNQNVTIRVHEVTSGVDATKAEAFRYVTALQITSIDNNQQRVDQAFTPVTIHGQGFLSPVAVTLAGIPAKVLSVTATELLVLPGTPFATACADITGAVVVTNIDSGDSKSGPNFIYQVAQTKPEIASVTPAVGQPGTTVTITGTNLGNITSVTFGGRPAAITSVSAGSVVVTVPDNGAPAPACPVGTPTGTPTNVGVAADVVVTSALTGCSGTAASSFQYQLPCKPGADLSIAKTASPNPVVTGSLLTYTLGVSNNGPNTATGVVVNDPVPGGTSFFGCTPTQGTCTLSGGTVVANLGDLPAPGFVSVRIFVIVTAPGGTSIINTAVVSSTTPDSNSANNSATVSTDVLALPTATPTATLTPTPTPTPNFADLAITKTASPNPVAAFGSLNYNITVGNNGPNPAVNTVVSDPLPGGTTYVSCSTSQGRAV